MTYQAVVLGAGINGLSTCYHLLRAGLTRVALLEQFELGHGRGSSHGESRITRSTYHASRYVDLVGRAHRESWPQLEEEAGKKLLTPCPGCFFGPKLGVYLEALSQVPAVADQLEYLSPEEARRRVPAFRFENTARVVMDHSAAVVSAAQTVAALIKICLARGATVMEECRVVSIDHEAEPLRLHTSRGEIDTERLVVTAGPWTAGLVPQAAPHLRVARQHVGYFRLGLPLEQQLPGPYPVWVYADEPSYYGLPEFGRPGVKIACHRTGAEGDDPDAEGEAMPERFHRDLLEFARAQLACPVEQMVGAEICHYTNAPGEDFVLDVHPGDPRVIVGAGFSGHGFKFGPLTGRILAELCLHGTTQVDEFEQHRHHFQLASAPRW